MGIESRGQCFAQSLLVSMLDEQSDISRYAFDIAIFINRRKENGTSNNFIS